MPSSNERTNPECKRRQLERQLREQHGQLRASHSSLLGPEGPCLVFGRYYALSPVLYLSLNPPPLGEGGRGKLQSENGFNIPFRNSPQHKRDYLYLRNCEGFLERHENLRAFLENKVTSAFLVPWRTRTLADLYRLNVRCAGKLFTSSRSFLCTMLRDHEASLLFVAGASALRLLQVLQIADAGTIEKIEEGGAPGTYQWSRSQFWFDGRRVTVLQIPHFSRANSMERLDPLAAWLAKQLAEYQAGTVAE